MRRLALVVIIALPWALLAYIVWEDLRSMDWGLQASTDAHSAARQSFFVDLAYEGCVPRAAVIAAAEARGWPWEDREQRFCHAPRLEAWIAVEVEPALPFSTQDENTAFIGFDGEGCMAQWDYTACD